MLLLTVIPSLRLLIMKQFSLNVQLSSKACEPLPVIEIKDKLSFMLGEP